MKSIRVKNRAPAAIQITAEQLLREARERAEPGFTPAPEKITDEAELQTHQLAKRQDLETLVRLNRRVLGWYVKYAKWEESQLEFRRARSIYERAATNTDYTNANLWLRYAEFEMRNKFVNHARNVWDRAVGLLPRVSQLWYKYAYMEEMLGNVDRARTIFERWMRWEPEDKAWFSYIKLEERAGEMRRARDLYERFCACHVDSRAYIKYAKWEEKHEQKALARSVFERALEELPEDEVDQTLFVEFARFEERCLETDRTRAIFKLALDSLPKAEAREVYNAFVSFEKQHGSQQGVEDVIVAKRRGQYEQQVVEDPRRYDSWFDYVRLEEAQATAELDLARKDGGGGEIS
jgi:crooked neck